MAQGLGCSVLPDYLCTEWIASSRLTLILKLAKAVTNSIWLAYRKSERQSQQVAILLNWIRCRQNQLVEQAKAFIAPTVEQVDLSEI